MVHDNVSLTVSTAEATKVDDEVKRRLLASRKLSLVVDLDQTIIHATVDPTVAEWQKDEKNPNHDAVKDVRAFQLVDDGPGSRGCWYFIKLRPGLKDFLEYISTMYELHIYTMGTRAYAQNIATIIDPDRKIFGDRILSRDESGSLVAKNLQRLFPVDTKMVVIIDDRGDVWGWNENFVKVTPYDFFVGIGDINSSFLPKKPEANLTVKAESTIHSAVKPELAADAAIKESSNKTNRDGVEISESSVVSTSTATSALEQLVSMGGGDDHTLLQAQTSLQDETLAAQRQDRPLFQKQKQLEAEDASCESSGNSDTSSDDGHSRHKLLQDNDEELKFLEESLTKVHSEYFEAYTRQLPSSQGGRVAELRGSLPKRKHSVKQNQDLAIVPDVKEIMTRMKRLVLAGVVIVFSGVIPLHLDWNTHDTTLWARNFGARVERDISRRTTHLVAARNRTAKVRQAAKRGKGRIKVVTPAWLTDSIIRWKKLDEWPYLLNTDEDDSGSGKGGLFEEDDMLSEDESSLGSDDPDLIAADTDFLFDGKERPALTLEINETEDETDLEGVLPGYLEDEHSPVGGTNEDWTRMHDELAEFLGSDAEDSDAGGSIASIDSSASKRGKKRTRGIESGDEDATSAEPSPQKKAKRGAARTTILTQNTEEECESGLPTPNITSGEEGEGERESGKDVSGGTAELGLQTPDNTAEEEEEEARKGKDDGEHGNNDSDHDDDEGGVDSGKEGDGWSDFDEDLEAEMEKAASENQGEG